MTQDNILFKTQYSFEHRINEADRIRTKYPDRIPVIVELKEGSNNTPDIDKKKFLVPKDLTVGQFIYVIRKRVQISAEQALFIFIDDIIPSSNSVMNDIYNEHKDEDNFLYVTYTGENTFGKY